MLYTDYLTAAVITAIAVMTVKAAIKHGSRKITGLSRKTGCRTENTK
jgi:hypothetical protein